MPGTLDFVERFAPVEAFEEPAGSSSFGIGSPRLRTETVNMPGAPRDDHLDRLALGAVLRRVGEQVGQDLLHPVRVEHRESGALARGAARCARPGAAVGRARGPPAPALDDHRRPSPPRAGSSPAARRRGDPRSSAPAVARRLRSAPPAAAAPRPRAAAAEQVGVRAHQRERLAEIVRDHGGPLLALALGRPSPAVRSSSSTTAPITFR